VSETRRRHRLSLSAQVLLGLVLGIASGLFFGEAAAKVQIIGDAFIRLLQMTVVPYIAVSLIGAVGGLDYGSARQLALKGGAVLLMTWAVALSVVVAMPLAFPVWESASFFSTSLVAEREPFDFLGLYIPSNPLFSMSHDAVPAVVLFSIVLGVALIGVERKRGLLQGLASLEDALMRITSFVARLAPIGVFALTASAAGTLPFDDLERLQVFLVGYALASLLMAFFILPGLVGALTPLRWRDVVPPVRDAAITAFATGNLLIVIPILSQKAQEVVSARSAQPENASSAVEVIIPASFNFPSAGKLLTLSFLPFGAWFTGSSIPAEDWPAFLVSGLFTFFGSTVTAVPFLLDFLRIPADLFQILRRDARRDEHGVPGLPGRLRDGRRAAHPAAAPAALRGRRRGRDARSLPRAPGLLRPRARPRRGHLPEVHGDELRGGAARGEVRDRGAPRADAAARGLRARAGRGRAAPRLLRPGQPALRVRERAEPARGLRHRDGPPAGARAPRAAGVRPCRARAPGRPSQRRDL
jgi:Na+/H+-dicarboxylate symporter